MFLSFSFFPFFSSIGSSTLGISGLVSEAFSASFAAPDKRSSREVALAEVVEEPGADTGRGSPPGPPF